MKNLAKLNGAKALSKNEQKSVTGGGSRPGFRPSTCCDPANQCCTTTALVNQPLCGGTYQSGCQYHVATSCCI